MDAVSIVIGYVSRWAKMFTSLDGGYAVVGRSVPPDVLMFYASMVAIKHQCDVAIFYAGDQGFMVAPVDADCSRRSDMVCYVNKDWGVVDMRGLRRRYLFNPIVSMNNAQCVFAASGLDSFDLEIAAANIVFGECGVPERWEGLNQQG